MRRHRRAVQIQPAAQANRLRRGYFAVRRMNSSLSSTIKCNTPPDRDSTSSGVFIPNRFLGLVLCCLAICWVPCGHVLARNRSLCKARDRLRGVVESLQQTTTP